MTKPSLPYDLLNQSFDALEDQLEIASDTVDSITAGIHGLDALPSLSSQLEAIWETAIALRLVVIPSESNEIKASYGNTILENECSAIDENERANDQGGITKPTISLQTQYSLLNAAAYQVSAIGYGLSTVLARVSGDTLAGRPSKKTLMASLGGICERLGVVSRLFGAMQFAYLPEPYVLDESERLYVEDVCRNALASINTPKEGI